VGVRVGEISHVSGESLQRKRFVEHVMT